MRTCLFVISVLCLALTVNVSAASKSQPPARQGHSVQVQAMNRLVKMALAQSLNTIMEKQKPIFPFALLQYKDGGVHSLTYNPPKKKGGSTVSQPDAQAWAGLLFERLRKLAKQKPDLQIVLLARMDTVKNNKGKKVKGIWVEVDNRDVRPWVIFLPLLKNKDGTYRKGDMIYYATNQPFFPHPEEANKTGHKKVDNNS